VFIVFVFSRSVIRARVAPCSDSDADSERIRACRHAGRRGKKNRSSPYLGPWSVSWVRELLLLASWHLWDLGACVLLESSHV